MKKVGKRPAALVAIVAYKAFTASLLTVIAISIFLAFIKYQDIQDYSDWFTLLGKRGIIGWILEKITNVKPRTLEFSAIGAGAYALVTAIEAVGLWYEQAWARWLVLFAVGVSIPFEIFEILKGVSLVKLVVFILNIAIFWYLLKEFPKLQQKSHDHEYDEHEIEN